MANEDKNAVSTLEKPSSPVEETAGASTRSYLQQLNSYDRGGSRPPRRPAPAAGHAWWRGLLSPLAVLIVALMVMVAMLSYGLGASIATQPGNTNTSSGSSGSGSTGTSPAQTTATTSVPNAPQDYGGQLAKYVIDPDGAKHFTLSAMQVMWQPVKGLPRVLAWTINGTVPAPARLNSSRRSRPMSNTPSSSANWGATS